METNKIYLGDAYKLIKQVADKSIDLIITDPPYEMTAGGCGKKELALRFRKRYQELQDNKLDVGLDFSFLKELERVCKHIYIYIWCNKILLFKLIAYYQAREDVNMDLITWGKTNPMPLCNNHFLNDTEYCLCIHEKGIGWNVNVGFDVKRKCYMQEVNKSDKDFYGHPTIKPSNIIRNFILNSSNEGDLVFDPFLGSGTVAAISKQLKRNFLGFEIDKDYFQMAQDRINGTTKVGIKEQMNLFDI